MLWFWRCVYVCLLCVVCWIKQSLKYNLCIHIKIHHNHCVISIFTTGLYSHFIPLTVWCTWLGSECDVGSDISTLPLHLISGDSIGRKGLWNSMKISTKHKSFRKRSTWPLAVGWHATGGPAEQLGGFYHSRKVWREQCHDHNTQCKWQIDWNKQHDIGIKNVSLEIKHAIDQSWYTLIPIGDYLTRGSIFDMLVSNSIGILERKVSHALPFLDMIDYSQIVKFIEPSHRILDDLTAHFNQSEAVEMIQRKFALRHLFQYSLSPNHKLVSFPTRHIMHEDDDAFTFTLKTLIRRLCNDGHYKQFILKCWE